LRSAASLASLTASSNEMGAIHLGGGIVIGASLQAMQSHGAAPTAGAEAPECIKSSSRYSRSCCFLFAMSAESAAASCKAAANEMLEPVARQQLLALPLRIMETELASSLCSPEHKRPPVQSIMAGACRRGG